MSNWSKDLRKRAEEERKAAEQNARAARYAAEAKEKEAEMMFAMNNPEAYAQFKREEKEKEKREKKYLLICGAIGAILLFGAWVISLFLS